ncbi:MAG TPA: hypothetical protein VL635_01095 [Trinickia sp.]|nr:hypothetical protein [Trinickia sp.]
MSAASLMANMRCRATFAAAALAGGVLFTAPASAAAPRYTFAVVSGAIRSPADEAAAARLIEAIGLDERRAFVVYDGNIKSADERCSDTLYDRRQQLLQASTIPLVVIPGQHDWADCATAAGGRYDAAERLDFLRQTMFSDTVSLGTPTLPLTRESEVARFRAFRENVRWEMGDTVFVGLNVVGGNNHYSDAGGRNGEFDDRAIASSFWLEHAAEFARRRGAKALVVFVEADPNFARYEEHADRFAWLRFARHRPRDGYLEFKRSLVKAAQTFRGPVIVIHHDAHAPAAGFTIDQPLYNDKGSRVDNLTRIAIAPHDPATQWVAFDVDFNRPAPFRVSVRTVPKVLPALPSSAAIVPPRQTATPASEASGPAIEPLPGMQNVPPAPPPQAQPSAPAPASPATEPPLLPAPSDVPPLPASAPAAYSVQGGGS